MGEITMERKKPSQPLLLLCRLGWTEAHFPRSTGKTGHGGFPGSQRSPAFCGLRSQALNPAAETNAPPNPESVAFFLNFTSYASVFPQTSSSINEHQNELPCNRGLCYEQGLKCSQAKCCSKPKARVCLHIKSYKVGVSDYKLQMDSFIIKEKR